MTVEYEWDVVTARWRDKGGASEVIYQVVYRVTATDGAHSADHSFGFDCGAPSNPMIPRADITKADLMGWLSASAQSDAEAQALRVLTASIERQASNPQSGLPWASDQ